MGMAEIASSPVGKIEKIITLTFRDFHSKPRRFQGFARLGYVESEFWRSSFHDTDEQKWPAWVENGGFPKMVGLPNWPMGFPPKNDQHLGCEMVGFPSNLRKQPSGKYSPSFKQTVCKYDISNGVPEKFLRKSTRRDSAQTFEVIPSTTNWWALPMRLHIRRVDRSLAVLFTAIAAGWRITRCFFFAGSEFQAVGLSNGKNKELTFLKRKPLKQRTSNTCINLSKHFEASQEQTRWIFEWTNERRNQWTNQSREQSMRQTSNQESNQLNQNMKI